MNKIDSIAIRRTRCPRGNSKTLHQASATTAIIATPLVIRCVNSMIVSIRGTSGTTSPLHSGQWLPQPAPEPLARTYAPQRITNRFQASTPQPNRVNPVQRGGRRESVNGASVPDVKKSIHEPTA